MSRESDQLPSPKPKKRAHAGGVCPICGGAVTAESKTLPFCSSRCRMADLHKWFSGERRISRGLDESDLEEID